MFAASVFIATVKFFLVYIIWLAERKNKRKKKNRSSVIESYFLRKNIEP